VIGPEVAATVLPSRVVALAKWPLLEPFVVLAVEMASTLLST
jgi:hypothetical protein